ncbi:AAA family ATPase [Halococcus agarilyticus]|uniref:AAA family ATPase n=1 Tax=Halococcus agarilyticus TaxID=1232219 RepID=UPI0006782786|nr:MoxR family ATPase [Halococcus agarilyticus]
MAVADASERCQRVVETMSDAIVADEVFFEDLLVGLLAGGHVLIEDVPGTGKTLTARSMATVLGLSFSRVQLTPDLLPADVTGTQVFDQRERAFEFREGPLFANVVLADELNRAPPKTQAALLEAMEEGQVTVEGETHPLATPFFVVATQNPVEQSGTFELPEAQKDRFLLKTSLGYPERDGERSLLERRLDRDAAAPSVDRFLDPDAVRELRDVTETVSVDPDIVDFMLDIARGTRSDRRVRTGVSPRGTQRLLEATRARAVLEGREYVVPDDVTRVAGPVMAHRLVLTPEAEVREVDKDEVLHDVVDGVPVPTVEA